MQICGGLFVLGPPERREDPAWRLRFPIRLRGAASGWWSLTTAVWTSSLFFNDSVLQYDRSIEIPIVTGEIRCWAPRVRSGAGRILFYAHHYSLRFSKILRRTATDKHVSLNPTTIWINNNWNPMNFIFKCVPVQIENQLKNNWVSIENELIVRSRAG